MTDTGTVTDAAESLPPVAGVALAAGATGMKYRGRDDLALMLFAPGTTVAGVFTQSRCAAASVELCRRHIKQGQARVLVAHAGNANAFTGERGRAACLAIVDAAARAVGCAPEAVLIASTGAIGQVMDPAPITSLLPALVRQADAGGWRQASRAILTTDIFAKTSTRTVLIDDVPVTLNGIAKGAGMIAPDMATMLAFVVTDAAISADVLQELLVGGVAETFNAITVDGDTSTNDSVLLFATGTAAARGAPRIEARGDPRLGGFSHALSEVLGDLAMQIVRDAEGNNKVVTVVVRGAQSAQSAKRVALAIAESPRVKISLGSSKPNLGRIVMAVGKAGEPVDPARLGVKFGDVVVASEGEAVAGMQDPALRAYMEGRDIRVDVDLGVGSATATVWTSALTPKYLEINSV